MIEQSINLYQERFRKKRLLLSANQVLVLITIAGIALGVWFYTAKMELDRAMFRNESLKAEQVQVNQNLSLATTEFNRLMADTRVDDEIMVVSREISERKKVLVFVDTNQFGSGQGFSHYLSALSELQVKNVWLDEISLAKSYVRIRGSSLSAEMVPVYFNRFSDKSVFRGKRFDVFQLDRREATDWKVDFEIATIEGVNE